MDGFQLVIETFYNVVKTIKAFIMILLSEVTPNLLAHLNIEKLTDFFIRLFLYSLTTFILIRYVYYPKKGDKEMIVNLFLMGFVIFVVSSLLDKINFNLGFAVGLFAIFSIIRFRTPSIEVREITYLFIIIGISIINALVVSDSADFYAVILVDILIILIALGIERYASTRITIKKSMTFIVRDLGLINSPKDLLEEVRKKTKINIHNIDVRKINAAKKELLLWIYYETK